MFRVSRKFVLASLILSVFSTSTANAQKLARLDGCRPFDVALSPSGKHMAICGLALKKQPTGMLQVWERMPIKLQFQRTMNTKSAVVSVRFSPSGKALATTEQTGGTGLVSIYDFPTMKRKLVLKHGSATGQLEFSPNGKHLVFSTFVNDVGGGYALTIWNTAKLNQPAYVVRHDFPIHAMKFSNNSKYLATAHVNEIVNDPGDGPPRLEVADAKIHIWDVESGIEIARVPVFKDEIPSLAFTTDDKRIAYACRSGTVRVLDWARKRETSAPLSAPENVHVWDLAFTRDQRWLIVATQERTGSNMKNTLVGTIQIWDFERRILSNKVKMDGGVTKMACSPDGKIVLAAGATGDFAELCILPDRWMGDSKGKK